MTKRVKLVVAYDGTDFRGWAAQTGRRTVQSTLKDAVRQVSGEDCEIVGASRTDSGAHARGQVCHFDSEVAIEPERWARVLNRVLPLDVGVVRSSEVGAEFNSRFWARNRAYRYRIWNTGKDPFEARTAHVWEKPLDMQAMADAARSLVGKHDFRGYTEELADYVTNTERKLFSVDVSRAGQSIRIDIVGTAFLRGMMRRMAGGLLEVGRGVRDGQEIAALLTHDGRSNLSWPEVLPARGLTLMKVRYGRHPRDVRGEEHASDDKKSLDWVEDDE